MIVGVGIDLVQNTRIDKALATHKLKFIEKVLTQKELDAIEYKKIPTAHLAGIFAAKEAVIKSLSSYLKFSLNFQEIVIKKNTNGVPEIYIQNKRAQKKLASIKLNLSISNEERYSIAISIAEIL